MEGVGEGAGPGACELGRGAGSTGLASWVCEGEGGKGAGAYSFAKTPLKAAQAPLAIARVSQRGEREVRLDIVIGHSWGC